jgi:hypothetical protein
VNWALQIRTPDIQKGPILNEEPNHLSIIHRGSKGQRALIPIKKVGVKSLLQCLFDVWESYQGRIDWVLEWRKGEKKERKRKRRRKKRQPTLLLNPLHEGFLLFLVVPLLQLLLRDPDHDPLLPLENQLGVIGKLVSHHHLGVIQVSWFTVGWSLEEESVVVTICDVLELGDQLMWWKEQEEEEKEEEKKRLVDWVWLFFLSSFCLFPNPIRHKPKGKSSPSKKKVGRIWKRPRTCQKRNKCEWWREKKMKKKRRKEEKKRKEKWWLTAILAFHTVSP